MNRLLSKNRPISNAVKVVSILSGKGGVGKSILTFNLGERLASLGYRVLIVDADVACGNLHILANVEAEHSYAEVISLKRRLFKSVCKINSMLDLLASPNSLETDESTLLEIDISKLINRIKSQAAEYDLILIDHPSGVSNRIVETALECDTNLLIIAPELTSIADGYGLFKRLVGDNQKIDCRFLINKSDSEAEAEHVAGKFMAMTERFVGQSPDYLGFIRNSQDVRTSVGRQLPIAAAVPQSEEIQSLIDISRRLVKALKLSLPSNQLGNNGELNLSPAFADTRG